MLEAEKVPKEGRCNALVNRKDVPNALVGSYRFLFRSYPQRGNHFRGKCKALTALYTFLWGSDDKRAIVNLDHHTFDLFSTN